MDQAKAQGQTISSAAQDGTFAAGVHRVTELLPVLMNDIISSAPEDQKVSRRDYGSHISHYRIHHHHHHHFSHHDKFAVAYCE